MKSGYRIIWTDYALDDLKQTLDYLEEHWTNKDVSNFVTKLESTLALVSSNPYLFPKPNSKDIHRVILAKHNTIYYRVKNLDVEIISLFSHRQNPEKNRVK